MDKRNRLLLLTFLVQLVLNLLAKGNTEPEPIVVISNEEEQVIDESEQPGIITETQSEDSEAVKDILPESPKRVRRQILFSGGGFGSLPNSGSQALQTDFSVTQNCDGVTIHWKKYNLPYSSEYKYDHKQSDFKYYNIYRSTSYFDDVTTTTMKPYKSGRNELLLRMVQTDTWKDMFPPTNKPLYYAVTYVQGNGNEIMLGKLQKVIFYGAIEKQGRLLPLIPKILRGKALHHSVTYNPTLDHYLVAFDWDQNNDGRPDHLYAMRLDYQGRIVGRNILNFTATVPGWIGGEQGWPSVTYNQRTDEFFVLFHFRSLRHFGNVHVILGQRILTRSRLTARARSPILVAKATSNNGWSKVPISHPTVIYNPKTGGYAATAVISNPRKEVHVLFLNSLGKMSSGKSVFSFSTNAYEPNLWWDSKREEIYFTCQISREAAVGTADFKLQPGQYLVVATKMNATGAHAANSPTQSTKQFVGYTDKRHANIQGYYNPRLDRLVLFWENFKNGRNTISTTSILLTRQRYTRDENKWYNCPIQREVRSPVVTYMETSGSHYMIWEEKTNQVWSIGGYKLQGNMNRRNREQRNPAVVFNTRRKSLFVVFQEVLNGQNVYLFGQHVRVAASFSCTKGCGFNEKCVQQDVCISKNSNPCFVKNGGCSHFCSFTAKKGVSCSCPVDMELSKDFMTCIPLRPCKGQAPRKDASGSDLSCSRGFRKNSCPKGSYCQVLSGKCCPAVLPGYSLYLATVGDIWEFKARPSSSRASFTRIPISRGFNIVALSYDPVDKRVYWSDVQTRKISRAFLNGQGEHAIVDTNLVVPDGLALDTIDRKIYWTDAGTKKIERADMDGSNRASILTLNASENPRAIVLYRANRFLFWTNWGQVPKISRASFDGTNVVVLVSSNLGWPNGLIIDEPAKRIYWADAKTDKLESCDFNGNGRKTYVTKLSHPFGLALLNERIFWSDWETGAIHSADKNTGTATKILVEGLERPMGIFIHKDNSGIPCSDPGIPLNGGRNPKPNKNGKYKSGTKILFTCHPDYNLVGFGSTICRKSGKWSKVRPKCIAPPVFTSRPQNQTVDEGAYVVLKCKASSRYTTIKWIKNGKIIPSSGPNHLILSGSLILLKIFYEEKGFYTCEISNKAGVKTATVYLKVRGSQKIPCGVARFKRRGRIIGGHQVTKGSHPWQAMLWDKSKKKHFCGGSLITDKWVVTAAHCVTGNIFPSDIRVRLGKHIRTKVENFTEQSSDAKSVKTHPHYNSRTFDSDLALIELKDRVVFTDYVQPICLPSSKTDFSLFKNNATGTITGWGQKKKRRRSNKLQEVTIPVVSQATCKKAYQSYHITGNMFCAGQTNGGRDACQGDSGGPFSIENPKTKRTVLIGVISWGEGCGTKGKYGVYTRIYNFVVWIFNEIRNN